MYGKTVDDFEYRGVLFRWVLSPNRFIYRIYVESELIGAIPVVQVKARMLPSAIEALYPICDAWLENRKEDVDAVGAGLVATQIVLNKPYRLKKQHLGSRETDDMVVSPIAKKKRVAKGNGRKRKDADLS